MEEYLRAAAPISTRTLGQLSNDIRHKLESRAKKYIRNPAFKAPFSFTSLPAKNPVKASVHYIARPSEQKA